MKPERRIAQIVLLLAIVIAFGTVGYMLIEKFAAFDALYMTMITVAQVGFGEIPRALSPAGRVFTMVLILVGLGSMAYGLSTITALLVEGNIMNLWEKRRMEAHLAKIENHIVVCGAGQTGRHIAGELLKTRTPFVIIERNEAEEVAIRKLGDRALYIIGDATNTDVLRRARVQAARGLIACMPADKDNVFTLLSARELSSTVRTVSRLAAEESRPALARAGADAIVSIPMIGALRLASVMLRPVVVSVLDAMLHEPGDVRVEELPVGRRVAGQSLSALKLQERAGVIVFAVRRPDGHHAFNPLPHYAVSEGDVLIACASPEQIGAARRVLAEG